MGSSFGNEIFTFASKIFPYHRSITGEGVRNTLKAISNEIGQLKIHEIPSGTKVFDWTIPQEWAINDGFIMTPDGAKICDYQKSDLHVMGYSTFIDKDINLNDLDQHLYSLDNQPTAIPYITSYYKRRWGFCISKNERTSLSDGKYHAYIDAKHFDGSLSYGDLVIPGKLSKEILFSTYVCHPSLANNELSGPAVLTFLAKWLISKPRKYTYRLVFAPETIGSIAYIAKNINHLKQYTFAAFNVTCIGDERAYSYLPSRSGNTISDAVAKHVLQHTDSHYVRYTWLDRGSDERQYCSPGVDLPMASIMRSKYGCYPEYHSSLDCLGSVVTANGLLGGYTALKRAVKTIEMNCYPQALCCCEPQLSKRNLYPSLSTKSSAVSTRLMMNLLTYADSKHSLLDIATISASPIWEVNSILQTLIRNGLVATSDIE